MKRILFLLIVALVTHICASAVLAQSRATAGFQKLQSLVGDWEGKDEQGHPAKTNFKVIVSNTVVMETLAPSNMEDMVTLYSVDGDGIALIHYCPTNNQPRMRAIPAPGNLKELVFSFLGAGNLPSPSTGHEHKLVIRFEDDNHITETWTWSYNGKETPQVFHFTRKKSLAK